MTSRVCSSLHMLNQAADWKEKRKGKTVICHSSSICHEIFTQVSQDGSNAMLQVRKKIVPVNRKWPLHTLMAALQHHFPRRLDKSHARHVLIEYVMLKDINDTLEDAHRYSQEFVLWHYSCPCASMPVDDSNTAAVSLWFVSSLRFAWLFFAIQTGAFVLSCIGTTQAHKLCTTQAMWRRVSA